MLPQMLTLALQEHGFDLRIVSTHSHPHPKPIHSSTKEKKDVPISLPPNKPHTPSSPAHPSSEQEHGTRSQTQARMADNPSPPCTTADTRGSLGGRSRRTC
ncbi:hypothetical protein K458DRAFT_424313 [Lentithecium fluviatile CBS 122367]|uniref:Uncharacterized protein n=1 Tax=Lentithecium fluviatile CBS 122367 TaxID=1168545 RepID=A0A6G1IGC3_9PLEO|nr:hypothetical protein K458DRAFT_424313 [Lentithecium fluviatile CBS 122367]